MFTGAVNLSENNGFVSDTSGNQLVLHTLLMQPGFLSNVVQAAEARKLT